MSGSIEQQFSRLFWMFYQFLLLKRIRRFPFKYRVSFEIRPIIHKEIFQTPAVTDIKKIDRVSFYLILTHFSLQSAGDSNVVNLWCLVFKFYIMQYSDIFVVLGRGQLQSFTVV